MEPMPGTSSQNTALQSNNSGIINLMDTEEPNDDFNNSTYAASGLKTSLHGTIYQLQLLMLFAYQACKNQYAQFSLFSEMDKAEKFDDVVIKYKKTNEDTTWKWKFLQAKHISNPDQNKIKVHNLVREKDGKFNLLKYFISFVRIKNNSEFQKAELCEFILCTNTSFDFGQVNKRDSEGKTVLSQKEINLIQTWKNSFINDADAKNDILYFVDHLEFVKNQLSLNNKNQLIELFYSMMLDNVIESKNFENKDFINNFLHLKKQISKDSPKETLKNVNEILNTNTNLITTKKFLEDNVKQIRKVIVNEDTELKNFCIKLNSTRKKNLDYQDQLLDCKGELKKIVENLIDEIQKSETQIHDYINPNTDNYRNLRNETDEIFKFHTIIKTFLESMENISTTEDLCEQLEKSNLMQYTNEKRKKSNYSIENLKVLIQKDLEIANNQIVLLRLLLNENEFLENINEFMNKFRFVTKYPDVNDLNKYLKNELGKDFKLLDADLVSHSFEKKMCDWWKEYNKGRSHLLTEKTARNFLIDIQQQVHNLLTSGISTAYPDKLRSYRISFNYPFNFNLTKKNFLHIITNFTRLTAINILETLDKSRDSMDKSQQLQFHDSYIFLRIRTLLREQTQDLVSKSYKSPQNHHLLVIEYQPKSIPNTEKLNEIFNKLYKTLTKNNQKKLILITTNNEIDYISDEIKNSTIYKTEEFNIDFNKLSEDSQQSLLKKICNFQGKDVQLNKIINYKSAQLLFSEKILNLIIENKIIKIGDTEAFYFNDCIQEYYIPRNIHMQKVKEQVFNNLDNKLFFVTGIKESKLEEFGVRKDYIHKYNKAETYQDAIILCEDNDQNSIYENLLQNNDNIHWLDFKYENLYWKKSSGSLQYIEEHIDKDYICNENYFHEDKLTHYINEKIIIIANDAGVGKSTFLTSLAGKLQRHSDCTWIIRINLNDFAFNKQKLPEKDKRHQMKCLKEITFTEHDTILAIEYFVNMAMGTDINKNHFQCNLLKLSLERKDTDYLVPKIVILFDGFDEISPNYSDQTITLVKAIQRTNVSQIYITTRIHEKNKLENELQTPALMLKPLDIPEQISFLIKFWQYSLKFFKLEDNQYLRKQIVKYLKEISLLLNQQQYPLIDKNEVSEVIENVENDKISNDNNTLRNYVNGINFTQFAENLLTWKDRIIDKITFNIVPLHLRMLAEIIFYNKFELNENFNILDLYNKFVEIKYDIYYDEKKNLGNTVGSEDIRDRDTTGLRKDFHLISLQVLFPDSYNDEISDNKKVQLARIGLLILKGTQLTFIHRTFAGYFFSEYSILKFASTDVQVLLFKTVLFESSYNFVREFFDLQLELPDLPLDNIEISEKTAKSIYIKPCHNNILHTIIYEGYKTTLEFIIKKIIKYPDILEKLLLTIGYYAPLLHDVIYNPIRRSKIDPILIIQIILNNLKDHTDVVNKILSQSDETDGLMFAGKQTSFTIIEKSVMDKNPNLLKTILNSIKDNKELIRTALMTTTNGLLNLVYIRISTKELFENFLNVIIFDKIDEDLILKLLLDTDKSRFSVLHKIARGNAELLESFLKVLNNIIENNGKNIVEQLLQAKNQQNMTALDIAVDTENCSNIVDLLTFLKSSFTDTLFKNITSTKPRENVLYKAMVKGKSKSTECLLNWFYSNIDKFTLKNMLLIKETDKRSALHLICGRGHHETLLMLLNFLKDVSELTNIFTDLLFKTCNQQENALWCSLHWKHYLVTNFFLNFLSENIDKDLLYTFITMKNKFGQTLIFAAVESGSEESLEFLLQFILNNFNKKVLEDILLTRDNISRKTALHNADLTNNICKVLLDFVYQNLDIQTLKSMLLKSDEFGHAPIYWIDQDLLGHLQEKINIILNIILEPKNHSEMEFTMEELDTIQFYLQKHSRREDKQSILDKIEYMKTRCTINDEEIMDIDEQPPLLCLPP